MIFRSSLPDITIPEISFQQAVLSRAVELSDQPALIDGPTGRTYTYGQLAAAVRLVAASLARRGFQKGECMAIFSPNTPEYAIALLAVASLGGVCTTINPLYTIDELTFQLNDASAKYLLTIPPFMDKAVEALGKSGVKKLFVFGEAQGATSFSELLQGDGQVPLVEIDVYQDLVVLPYSSGTTGLPKGVMLTHHNLVSNIYQMNPVSTIGEQDRVICILPMFHIYGMMGIMAMCLFKGATMVTMPRFDLEQFLQTLQDYKITLAPLVPPIMVALAKHPVVDKYDLSHLTKVLSAAAPLSRELEQACAARINVQVAQGYGMTETSPCLTLPPTDLSKSKTGAVGMCLPGLEMKVIDLSTGAELEPNQEGEVCTRGPQVMKGYLNRPDATANMIESNGWLHTGDVGYMDEEGFLFIVDRVKELIKYKGMQVAPAELEAVLLTHSAVADAAVIPIPNEEAGELPKGFVVLKPGATTTAEELMAYVAARVAPHKKIRQLELIDQIPKSASGKILRRFLVDRERQQIAAR